MRKGRVRLAVILAGMWLAFAAIAEGGMTCYQYQYAPNLVRSVQQILKKQKLYKGKVDGKWGDQTRSAVARYQDRNGIRPAEDEQGELGKSTLKALFGPDAPSGVTVVRNPDHAPEDLWNQDCK